MYPQGVNNKETNNINIRELVIYKKPFAEGGYGSIYTCEYKGRQLVAKRLELTTDGFIDKPFEPLLMACNIPYVNNYRKILFDKEENAWFILQDVGLSLKSYRKHQKPSLDLTCKWFKMLLTGLDHLHRYDIIHGDIKPDNILIFPPSDINSAVVKISDLGLSCINHGKYDRYICTAHYRPLEVWDRKNKTCKSDIWCLGVSMYYMITGEDLFSLSYYPEDKQERNNAYYNKIMEWKDNYAKGNTFNIDSQHPLRDIIYAMLHPSPKQRPTCKEILKKLKHVTIPKLSLEEIHVEGTTHQQWIKTLILHEAKDEQEADVFATWFVNKIYNGHHLVIPEGHSLDQFLYLERWLVSNTCYVPKWLV